LGLDRARGRAPALLPLAAGGARHDRAGERRLDRLDQLAQRRLRARARVRVRPRQGGPRPAHAAHGARVGGARHPRQRDRARLHGHAARRSDLGGRRPAPLDLQPRPARAARPPARARRRLPAARLRRGLVPDRPDPLRRRRRPRGRPLVPPRPLKRREKGSTMRIAVVGAGAMGSIFAARLAQGGHDVALLDVAAALVDRINAEGVKVVRGQESSVTRVRATTDPAEIGPVDAAVFFVKCYHTAAAAELARPLVGPDTTVASLQNGWGNGDVLAGVYPPERIVVGVTYNSGLVLEPGVVMHPADQPTLVGPFADGDARRAEALAQALASGGLATTVATPVRPEIWKKLILNAATLPTAALTGMNAG